MQVRRSASEIATARALFARVSHKAPVLVPLNDRAIDRAGEGAALFCIHSIVGSDMGICSPWRAVSASPPSASRPRRSGWTHPTFGASLQALADSYAAEIVAAHPAGVIAVAGWSAGAAVALEVAHSLGARGRAPALLVAIDGAPENIHAGLRSWDPRYWLGVAANVPRWFAEGRSSEKGFPATIFGRVTKSLFDRARLMATRRRPETDFRLERMVDLDRYPASQRRFIVRLYDAIMAYRPWSWDGPVMVYEARAVLSLPQYLQQWRRIAPNSERALLSGNHVTIMREPRVAELARDLEARIRRLTATDASESA